MCICKCVCTLLINVLIFASEMKIILLRENFSSIGYVHVHVYSCMHMYSNLSLGYTHVECIYW